MRSMPFFTLGLALGPVVALGASVGVADGTGDPKAVTVTPGAGSFSVDVVFSGGVTDLRGVDFRVELVSASGAGTFELSARSLTAPLDEMIIENVYAAPVDNFNPGDGILESPQKELDTVTGDNTGALASVGLTAASGTLMTVTVDYAGTGGGETYAINIVGNDDAGASAPSWSDGAFADFDFTVDADYVITVSGPPVALEGITSVRTHGIHGPIGLALPASPVASEPRQNGSAPQMVFDFDGNIEAIDGSADCGVEVVVLNGTCNSVSISGDKLTVNMTYNKNQCVSAAVTGLRGAGGGAPILPATGRARTIEGDADNTTSINILDLANIKNQLFASPIDASNFRLDIDCTGSINILDLANTKNNLFAPQPACP